MRASICANANVEHSAASAQIAATRTNFQVVMRVLQKGSETAILPLSTMKISDVRATTVTVPLEAPLRHANGCHWGRFVRTIVEVDTDEGITGLGEMGGGGESAEATFRAMKSYLVGRDPARIEEMRFLISNPTASLYNNRTQILAALEFACLDICGQKWGVPVYDILGGKLQDRVPFASYLFFRFPGRDGKGETRTVEQLAALAKDLKRRFGFTSHKLKGGVFAPEIEIDYFRAVADAVGEKD